MSIYKDRFPEFYFWFSLKNKKVIFYICLIYIILFIIILFWNPIDEFLCKYWD